MKLLLSLTLLFTAVAHSIYASEKELSVSCKILTPTEVKYSKVDALKIVASDKHATIISFEHLPKESEVHIKVERPLLREIPSEKDKKYHQEFFFTSDGLMLTSESLQNDKPCFLLTSDGYLPGEEVKIYFECNGYKSKPLVHTPQPIKLKSRVDGACIKIKLKDLISGNYQFEFVGFQPKEKIKFTSTNCGEVISGEHTTNNGLALMCGVVGFKGGLDRIKFTRGNGEVLEVTLPWGTELLGYLTGEKKTPVTR